MIVEPIACIAAMATNRPVKFVYDRYEEMQVSSPRAAERIYIKDGVMDDGRIVARKVTLYVDAGAYSPPQPVRRRPRPPRTCPARTRSRTSTSTAYCVYTNRTPSSAMRGFGVTIGDFALESQMDRIARALDMDPLQLRLKNAYRDGDMKAHHKVAEGTALIEVIQKAARAGRPRAARRVPGDVVDSGGALRWPSCAGAGYAAVNYPTGMNLGGDPSQALDALDHDRQLRRHAVVGRPRPGPQDGRRAGARPRRSACRYENIIVDTADTDTGPHCMGTFAAAAPTASATR